MFKNRSITMTILIYTTLTSASENQQNLFNILFDLSNHYSGLHVHIEDNRWVIGIDNNIFEHSVMNNLQSILPTLNIVLSKYNSAVIEMKRVAFLRQNSRSFADIMSEKLGGAVSPLVKLSQPRLQAIDRRYSAYIKDWKKEYMRSLNLPVSHQHNPALDDSDDELLQKESTSIEDQNSQIIYESQLRWFSTCNQQSAYIEKEKTFIYIIHYLNNAARKGNNTFVGLAPFGDFLMHPHKQSVQISTTRCNNDQPEFVKIFIKFVKHNIIELNSINNMWTNINEFTSQLTSYFKDKGMILGKIETKINMVDHCFEITLDGLHLEDLHHEPFMQDIDICLFLSSISEIAYLGNINVSLQLKKDVNKSSVASAPLTHSQTTVNNSNNDSISAKLSSLKIGSPITQVGDAHQALYQRIKPICDSKMPDFKPFLDAIEQKNYGKALRTACTSTDEKAFELIKLLFSYKDKLPFDVNEQTGDQRLAAIHHSAKKGNVNVYNYLKEKEANHLLTDKDNITAEEYLDQYIEKNVLKI